MRNSTIITKKRNLDCGCYDFAFSKNKCKMHASADSFQKRLEKENEKVIQEEDLSGLIEDADTIFSRFIRLKYANENGIVKCYTCNILLHWTMIQNGHFIKRAHLYLRWSEANCKPQCPSCNEMKHGNIVVYRERLEKEQPCLPESLQDQCKLVYKPTREEIRQIISEYTPKVAELKKRLKK